MSNFIVSDWFADRAKLNIQTFDVEGIEFEIMALAGELKEKVELCDSYNEMLLMAANTGLSYNRKRISDDAELSKDLDVLWEMENLTVDTDPSIKHQVGKKVCEISGLDETLKDQLDAEEIAKVDALKEQGHINGDGDTPLVSIDQLNDDAAA